MSSNVLRKLIQISSTCHISLKSILILSSHLDLSSFPATISVAFIISSKRATFQHRLTFLEFFHVRTFQSLIKADQLGGFW